MQKLDLYNFLHYRLYNSINLMVNYMKIINYTEARTNLRKTLDECVDDSMPVCIISKNNQVVMLNKDDYDSLIEQRHVERQLNSQG